MKHIFFCFLFFSNILLIFSQTGIVKYKGVKTAKNKIDNEMIRKIDEEITRLTFTLVYDKNKSFFKKDKNIAIYPLQAKLAAIFMRSNTDWHQFNTIEKLAAYHKIILNKPYVVNHSEKMKNWELFNEVKIIDGYTCYKATNTVFNTRSASNIITTAWYTPEIPVPYGPIGYGGLPGLILKLDYANSRYFLVDKITLNPKNMEKIPFLKYGKKISVKEMVRLSRSARKVTPD